DEATLQFQATTLDYNEYVGRIAIGRIINGKMKSQETVTLIKSDGTFQKGKITKLYGFKDLGDRKSTRLNSSHVSISYAVFCLKIPPTTPIYTLSLHDALPISMKQHCNFRQQRLITTNMSDVSQSEEL